MQATAQVVTVVFPEHPYCVQPSGNVLDVSLSTSFSMQAYCDAVFHKILHIGLSESAAFLSHNCSLVSEPLCWLNALEKLIKLNADLFKTDQLKHRQIKFITEISIRRNILLSNYCPDHKTSHLHEPNGHRVYSFAEVRRHLETLSSYEEKLLYLNDQIFDYRQNPPIFLKANQPTFDALCQIEIDRINQRQALQQKIAAQKPSGQQMNRLPFNGELKVLCDVYFKMMHKKVGGKPMLPCSISQVAEHICSSYCNPDGSLLSNPTVRTYLSSSRPESRPKNDKELEIDS